MVLYFPCDLVGLGKVCLAQLPLAMGINPWAPGWNILEWFQNITVSEMLKWFVLELFLNNIFIEQF